MTIAPTIFREYDIRGLVDKDLPTDVVRTIHRAYARFLLKRGLDSAIVGCDSRPYNAEVKKTAIDALRESGINVIDIGTVTSPVFYFSQLHLNVKGGSMVTASHNPMGWSGFKFLVDTLQTATSAELKEIQDIIAANDFPTGAGAYETHNVIPAYGDDVVSRIHLSKPLTVVIDSGNETTAIINPAIIKAIGAKVIEQCSHIGEKCSHEPNPSTLGALEHIAEGVKQHKADIGIGYDADGDRFGIVDEKGQLIWPDRVAMVIAREMLSKYPGGSIVFDVKCTQALPDDIKAHGGTPVMWKTGHSWIRRKGQEIDAIFAAERSGHFYFRRGHHGFDDGLFASLKLLEILAAQNKSLSELMKDFPQYETSPVWHAPCPDEKKYETVEKLTQHLKQTYGADNVIDINGARVQFSDGWGLVRASSNVPSLVLVFEGKTLEALNRINQTFRDLLRSYPEVGTEWESG